MRVPRCRPAALVTAFVGSLVALLLLPAGVASAHASLDSSTPASGAVLGSSPDELVLAFDETVNLDLGGVELSDADGATIDIPEAVNDPSDASTVLVEDLPELDDGVYVVVWEVSSSDGHPARGAFTFQVGSGASGVDGTDLANAALAGRSADSAVTWGLGVARAIAFAGLTVLFGAVLLHLVSGDSEPRRRARVLWWTSWGALVVGSLGVFALQGPYLRGGSLGDALDPSLWSDVVGTRLGRAILIRLALAALAAVLVRRAGRPRLLWVALGVAVIATFSTTGHPSAQSPALVSIVVDMVHVAAITVWIGGLAGVLVAQRPAHQATHRFSSMATIAVPVIVVSGGWQTWRLVGDLGDLTATTWGRTLLVKLSLVVVLVTLGAASRWLLRNDGPGAVRRLVATELVIGAIVLGVTAGLVATPPTPPPASSVFTATLAQGSLIADVSLTPGRVGANELHVVLSPPGGTLQPAVSASARLRSAGLPNVPVVLDNDGPNHYVGTVLIPSAGEWTLDLEVEPEANQTVLLSTVISIPD